MSDLNDLILPLHKATMDGKLTWSLEGERRISTLQGPGLIEIMEVDPYEAYQFTVRNRDGVVLESATIFDKDMIYFEHIKEIYQGVKRSALRVDETLDDIKRTLLSL